MRKFLRKILKNTKHVKTRYLNFLYRYDYERYCQYSATYQEEPTILATKLRLAVHSIEKGLSLPKVKKNFGRVKILEIIRMYEVYKQQPNPEDLQVIELSAGIIQAYVEHCKNFGEDISFIPEPYRSWEHCNDNAGVIKISKMQRNEVDFPSFAWGRHSLRQFGEGKIADELIKKVVALAQSAPSACNRQTIRIYAITNANKIEQIMEMHGGIRGFSVPGVIFIVAADLRLYQGEGERNTGYIDGGIFLMNMLYALESEGVAACPIIWCSEPDKDSKIYDLTEMEKSNQIIALIAAGEMPVGEIRVAKSQRRPLDNVLEIIK